MAFYSTMTNETQCKRTYYNFSNNEINPERFNNEVITMAKKTVYYLMYSGVPEYVIPLILQKASLYSPQTIKRDLYKKIKNNKVCVICGESKDLDLHHVKPIRDYPELKYRLDNLKPICKNCHKNLHDLE